MCHLFDFTSIAVELCSVISAKTCIDLSGVETHPLYRQNHMSIE